MTARKTIRLDEDAHAALVQMCTVLGASQSAVITAILTVMGEQWERLGWRPPESWSDDDRFAKAIALEMASRAKGVDEERRSRSLD